MIGRNEATIHITREIKFVFDSSFGAHTVFREPRDHAFEEGARAGFPGLAVGQNHVAHHAGAAGNIGQNSKCAGVGNEAKFSYRPHALDWGE